MEEAFLVLNVSQIPEFDRVVHRGRHHQPITSGIELCMRHFSFVQLVAKNLGSSKQNISKRGHCYRSTNPMDLLIKFIFYSGVLYLLAIQTQ